ncbi:MAG: bifunctional phosphopantothenoylcysteine decarboxylase/phosphopantothenate--cysteine ligase CoaBC [Bacteroidia bacterium]|nr:bifunctional phosphopantothenoylcysteine decarboxylase/phosphopantothenate--cysteine ligase CoaBC [Bacteroidia bacterium]
MLEGKKIILGICGSIAAYKAAFLVRLLVKEGAMVRVVTTPSAGHFVTDLTFSNLSKNPVFTGLWDGTWTEHVHLGNWGDLLLVAPATANSLSKMAHGQVDNALTAVYLAASCPVMVAPAMDADMFLHPATQANLQTLQSRGVHVLHSPEGEHASGLTGPGRFPEPEEILEQVRQFFGPQPLQGKKVLISAGPTREAIDPVRFLTNHSTGTMGIELAKAARKLGATVTLVIGPVSKELPVLEEIIRVNSAQEMYQAMNDHFQSSDLTIMSAAVADYTPETVSDHKIKKQEGDMVLRLKRTRDILKSLGEQKRPNQILVGFALETQNEEANAKSKLERKNLDFIVLNSLADAGAGFGGNTNKIAILHKNGEINRFPLKSKAETAMDIFQTIIKKGNED